MSSKVRPPLSALTLPVYTGLRGAALKFSLGDGDVIQGTVPLCPNPTCVHQTEESSPQVLTERRGCHPRYSPPSALTLLVYTGLRGAALKFSLGDGDVIQGTVPLCPNPTCVHQTEESSPQVLTGRRGRHPRYGPPLP